MIKFSLILLTLVLTIIYPTSNLTYASQPEIEFGTEISYIKYKEPDVMEEDGVMFGIAGGVKKRQKIILSADGRLAFGQVDYSSSTTGNIDGIDDLIFEIRATAGYEIPTTGTFKYIPYLGFGYRYLNDDSAGMTSSTGDRGFERESNYFYSPVGIETSINLKNSWTMSVFVEYDHFWRGKQVSHLSDVSLGYDDIENTQKKGYGVRGSLKFVKDGETYDIIIEPFIRYWNIKKSEETAITFAGVIIGRGYEPKNSSLETGIKFAFGF